MTQTVELKVAMSCGGCSGAVTRVLNKTEGVESFEIDMEQQKVTVKTSLDPEVVLQTVAKTGKKTSFWEAEVPAPAPAPAPAPEATATAEVEVKAPEVEVKAPEAEVKVAEPEAKTTEAVAVL